MNYLVQRGKVRGQMINVPEGLPELLSDITREVLRCQPTTECLCQFIMDYLHSVIVTREKAMMAKKIIDRALRTVDEIISDMCICDLSKAKNEEMAFLMEECFKRFLERRRCETHHEQEIVKFHEEDMLDELIKRCKFSDEELKISRPLIEEAYNRFVQAYMTAAEGTEGTEALYLYFKEREIQRKEERRQEMAATRIQANFRGFRVRQEMFLHKPDHEAEPEAQSDDWEEQDRAARTIQRFFRQHEQQLHSLTSEGRLKTKDDRCDPPSNISLGVAVPDAAEPTGSPKLSPKPLEAPAAAEAHAEVEFAAKPPEIQEIGSAVEPAVAEAEPPPPPAPPSPPAEQEPAAEEPAEPPAEEAPEAAEPPAEEEAAPAEEPPPAEE